MRMKKFITVLTLFAIFLLGGCNGEAEKKGAITDISFKTTTSTESTDFLFSILLEESAPEQDISKPIYSETQEGLAIQILNAFGAHDSDTFQYFVKKDSVYSGDYSKIYTRFCRLLPDDVDYSAERTYEDFEVYKQGDKDRMIFHCYLREYTEVGLNIMVRFDYEKELFYTQHISTYPDPYDTVSNDTKQYKLVDLSL